MGVGSGGERGGMFIHSTDKVEGSLIVLFLILFFSVSPTPPENFPADTLE